MDKRLWLFGGVAVVAAGAIIILAFMRPASSSGGIPVVRHESGSFRFLAPAHWQVHGATAAF